MGNDKKLPAVDVLKGKILESMPPILIDEVDKGCDPDFVQNTFHRLAPDFFPSADAVAYDRGHAFDVPASQPEAVPFLEHPVLSDPVEMRRGYNRLADEFAHATEVMNAQMIALRMTGAQAHSAMTDDEFHEALQRQVQGDPVLRRISFQICTLDALKHAAERLARGEEIAVVAYDALAGLGGSATHFAASVDLKGREPQTLALAQSDDARLYMKKRVQQEFLWLAGLLSENAEFVAEKIGAAGYVRDTGDDFSSAYAEACGGIYKHVITQLQNSIRTSPAPRVLKPSDYTLL